MTCSRQGSRVSPSVRRLGDESEQLTFGLWLSKSSRESSPVLSSQRMFSESRSSVPAPVYIDSGMSAATRATMRPTWVPQLDANDGGYLPTITTRMNFASDSMQKWPAYRRLRILTRGKKIPVEFWEWIQGFPIGWTACNDSETR